MGEIITPETKIIGSSPKVAAPSYEKEKEYNKNINEHHPLISKYRIKDNFVLVRLFKYDSDPTSNGGILLKEMKDTVTEGGRKAAELVNNPYQKRGVIAILADNLAKQEGFASLLKVGDIVHLQPGNFYGFHVDKSLEVDSDHGYFLIHVSAIECVETN